MSRTFAAATFATIALAGAFVGPVSVLAQGATAPIPDSVTVTPSQVTKPLTTDNVDLTNVFGPVMGTIMSLFAWLTGVAGVLLNQAAHYTVVQMGEYVHGLKAIQVAWAVLRDLGNIILIFGFLAIGIATIIDARIYGGGTKMLPILLIAAIFLNFSLFIAEAVIDVGNLFATQVYAQITGGQVADPTLSINSVANEGISNTIMNHIGLQTLYNISGGQTGFWDWDAATIFTGLLGIILFMVAAFVMFSIALILIARFVILLLLIIISPLGFAGLAVPKLEGYAKRWWEELFKQTMTAPVLLLTLYVALKVITDDGFLGGFGTDKEAAKAAYAGISKGSTPGDLTSFAGILLSFLVAMGLLMACVVIAKSMSAYGASWATKWGGRLSFGAAAFAIGAPIGALARTGRFAQQRFAPNSRAGRFITNWGLKPLEGIRPDLRRLPGVGAGLALAGAGEAATPIAKAPMRAAEAKYKEVRKSIEEKSHEYDKETRVPVLRAALTAPNPDAVAIGRMMTRMTDSELESHQVTELLAHHGLAAALLPQARFDKLQASEHVSNQIKEDLRTSRNTGVEARFANQPHPNQVRFAGRTIADVTLNGAGPSAPGVRDAFPGLSSNNRAELGGNILTMPHVMDALTGSDFAAIARRSQLDPASQQTISQYVQNVVQTTQAAQQLGMAVTPRDAQIVTAAAAPAVRTYYGLP